MRETRERLTYVFDVGVAIEAPDLFTAETTLGLVLDRMMAADYSVLSVAKYGAASVHRFRSRWLHDGASAGGRRVSARLPLVLYILGLLCFLASSVLSLVQTRGR